MVYNYDISKGWSDKAAQNLADSIDREILKHLMSPNDCQTSLLVESSIFYPGPTLKEQHAISKAKVDAMLAQIEQQRREMEAKMKAELNLYNGKI